MEALSASRRHPSLGEYLCPKINRPHFLFAVNHLGHYLLLRLFAPSLARNAIVVITSSNTYDPQFSPVAPFTSVDAQQLSHLDLEKGAHGSVVFESGFRAYATSKLCNLLTARAFAAVHDALRVFSIRTLVAAKFQEGNKQLISEIILRRESNFLTTDYIF